MSLLRHPNDFLRRALAALALALLGTFEPAAADYVVLSSGTKLYGIIDRPPGGPAVLTLANGGKLPLTAPTIREVYDPLSVFAKDLEALSPDKPQGYLDLGRVCAGVDGAETLALRLLRLATALADGNAELAGRAQFEAARLLLADAAAKPRRLPEPDPSGQARACLRRALRLNPADADALALLREQKRAEDPRATFLADCLRLYLGNDYEGLRARLRDGPDETSRVIFEAGTGRTWTEWSAAVDGHVPCPRCRGQGKPVCPKCRGRGTLPCAECRGTGTVKRQISFPGGSLTRDVPCRACTGTGKVPCASCGGTGKAPCAACRGTGFAAPDTLRQDARFVESCTALAARLARWQGEEPLFDEGRLLPVHPFDNRRMLLIGTATDDARSEVLAHTVFLGGRWLTPQEKQTKMP